ncbi:hypothetical protein D8I35_11185 [Corticibacter populi]|uniref:NrtR DNA-binding winged helix domain-containing protein n=1 Tax=Corticibacter populi TaxID=1550736 RepID=A0A3M6QRX3_9BURK|nr:hypothetical protein [Corticibacter populi]RMX05733.1 hypothetical protein D8I35_11185 [Corticibacter populi]RZS30969.1 hypothetical protein EV687_3171 [Corticibacter populi]
MTTDDTPTPSPAPASSHAIQAELVAVLVAVSAGQPRIMTTRHGQTLPCGPFTMTHRTLQQGMRAWVESETHHPIGYVEQLYTFADPERLQQHGARNIAISYLGLTREQRGSNGSLNAAADQATWRNWYDFFPWEDRRSDYAQALLETRIVPALRDWAQAAADPAGRAHRLQRVHYQFGLDEDTPWNEDFVLQRYELLYEARLVSEALRQADSEPQPAACAPDGTGRPDTASEDVRALPGLAMLYDHRRILATGMARLRAKLKYRPVMFELMPETFTLLQLQQTAEAITGCWLHKQNFRRLIEQQALVEETGETTLGQAGRPAKLYRFRSGVMHERAISGSKLPLVNVQG